MNGPGPSPTDLGLARDQIVSAQVGYSRLAMARPIARQDARERAFAGLAPQGDGTEYERVGTIPYDRDML
jgi:hypothetical protein